MILVTGSTGTFGSHVAKELQKKNIEFKAASFDQIETIKEKLGQNVIATNYDLTNPSTFDQLLDGIQALYLVAPSGSHQFSEQIIPLLQKAKEKSVKHIVLTTVLGADANPASSHYKAEVAVKESGINYTIVRPNFIFQNFINYDLWALKKGMIYLPTGDGITSYNDIRDIAAVIVEVLMFPEKHYNKTYSITGGEALSHSQMADIFTHKLGRTIKNINPTEQEYKETLLKFGIPNNSVDFLASLYSYIKLSYFKTVTSDYEKILNNKPTSFDQFVTDYKDIFNTID